MAKVKLEYSDAAYHTCGTMRCVVCRLVITAGPFRFFKDRNDEFHGHHHRGCCADDPMWNTIDRQQETEIAYLKAFLKQCEAFKKTWNVTSLDEDISDTIKQLEKYERT